MAVCFWIRWAKLSRMKACVYGVLLYEPHIHSWYQSRSLRVSLVPFNHSLIKLSHASQPDNKIDRLFHANIYLVFQQTVPPGGRNSGRWTTSIRVLLAELCNNGSFQAYACVFSVAENKLRTACVYIDTIIFCHPSFFMADEAGEVTTRIKWVE